MKWHNVGDQGQHQLPTIDMIQDSRLEEQEAQHTVIDHSHHLHTNHAQYYDVQCGGGTSTSGLLVFLAFGIAATYMSYQLVKRFRR